MNTEILDNELFIKIKDLISLDDEIIIESIGESDYAEILSLTEKDIPDLRKLAKLWLESPETERDKIIWDIAIFAWRSVAAINITEAVRLMLELLEESEKLKIVDELLSTELEQAGDMADKGTMVFLCDFIQIKSYDEWTTIAALECLALGLDNHCDIKNIAKEAMAKRFMDYENNTPGLNAFLIDRLTGLEAVELAEEMEKAFAAGKVDECHIGIWGNIRHRLGVPGIGLVPDGVRVTPDYVKELAETLKKIAAQNMANERQLNKNIKKNQKRQRKNLKKIRKIKRKAKR